MAHRHNTRSNHAHQDTALASTFTLSDDDDDASGVFQYNNNNNSQQRRRLYTDDHAIESINEFRQCYSTPTHAPIQQVTESEHMFTRANAVIDIGEESRSSAASAVVPQRVREQIPLYNNEGINDKELATLYGWEMREIEAEKTHREQPWYKFATLVAGQTAIRIEELIKVNNLVPLPPRLRLGANTRTWTFGSPPTPRATETPTPRVDVSASPPRVQDLTSVPNTPNGVNNQPQTPPQNNRQKNFSQSTGASADILGAPDDAPAHHLYQVARSLNRTYVTRKMFISPMLMGNVEQALMVLESTYPETLVDIRIEEVFRSSRQIQNAFATLVSVFVAMARHLRHTDKHDKDFAILNMKHSHAVNMFNVVRRDTSARNMYISRTARHTKYMRKFHHVRQRPIERIDVRARSRRGRYADASHHSAKICALF